MHLSGYGKEREKRSEVRMNCVETRRRERGNTLMSMGVTAPESMLMKCHAQTGNQ